MTSATLIGRSFLAVAFVTGCATSKPDKTDSAVAAFPDSIGAPAPATPVEAGYVIDKESMGALRLGMTLQQARDAMPSAQFKRTSDGEGVALVEVTFAPGSSAIVYAGEDNPEAPIDWKKSISNIETFSESFHTAEGAHPKAPVADVEKIYGKTKSTETSEIESRQYITFANQPSWVTFRLEPADTILSISISSR